MTDWFAALLVLAGAAFMFVAALGIVRLPDLFTRMHAAAKAASFGAGLLLAGAAVHFADAGVALKALAVVVFIFLTAPVASHMIGRVGYLLRIPLWDKTAVDELRDRYDLENRRLSS